MVSGGAYVRGGRGAAGRALERAAAGTPSDSRLSSCPRAAVTPPPPAQRGAQPLCMLQFQVVVTDRIAYTRKVCLGRCAVQGVSTGAWAALQRQQTGAVARMDAWCRRAGGQAAGGGRAHEEASRHWHALPGSKGVTAPLRRLWTSPACLQNSCERTWDFMPSTHIEVQ